MFIFFVLFLLFSTSFADKICYKNKAENLALVKESSLPKILQKDSVYFIGSNILGVKAAGSVEFFEDMIRFAISTNAPFDILKNPQVRMICVEKNVATLTFINHPRDSKGKKEDSPDTTFALKIVDDETIVVLNSFSMKSVTESAYKTFLEKIPAKSETKSSPAAAEALR